jgi:hypothetical protein
VIREITICNLGQIADFPDLRKNRNLKSNLLSTPETGFEQWISALWTEEIEMKREPPNI